MVLTHGALLSVEVWALLWQPLLAAGHQVIAYDLAAVLDHFDVRQGVVVAHSTGGIGALALAVGAPADTAARLAGQVLISTPPQGIGDSLQNRLLAPLVFSGLIHEVVGRRRLGTLFTRALFGPHPDPELVEFARRIMAGASRQTTIDAPKAVLRFDFRDRRDQVTLPTLILSGGKDRSVKPTHTQALADGIPTPSCSASPGAGHLVVLERAHQIALAVTQFAASRG
ncbi:MAG TPA: alpha/beta fold hydrolase [Actinomycetota bacterium]|nr:alpha/beta fold hydrolase [Actinomycetota bacterium]